MLKATATTLTRNGFVPFGDVLEAPENGTRGWFDGGLTNARPRARPSLSPIRRTRAAVLPLVAPRMERHRLSSRSFVSLSAGRWLVGAAPDTRSAPDINGFRAFIAHAGQGVTIAPGVWHLPLTALDAPADFAIFMWLDGGPDDEDWAELSAPLTICAP